MQYKELEKTLRAEAQSVAAQREPWPAERVARRLEEIADLLTTIRRQHETGINASMGKRSGTKIEI